MGPVQKNQSTSAVGAALAHWWEPLSGAVPLLRG